jgi:L-threonylcarbamoyladenylate synthase
MGTRKRRVSVIYFISKLVKWDDLPMEVISNPSQVEIKKAAQVLKDGHLVAFPTETVYGLGANATNEKAVSRVYSVKGRPTDHPLIVHISSISQLDKWAVDIPEYAIKLANKFWPGPMTLILKRSEIAKDFITGGQENVGVRVPSHPVALSLLSEFEKLGGLGIAAPSANKFGAVSPTYARSVYQEIGESLNQFDMVLDGGDCDVGIESTIISCLYETPFILRPGAITESDIQEMSKVGAEKVLRRIMPKVSGSFARHYSPKSQVVLGQLPKAGDGYLALNTFSTPKGVIRLAAPESAEDFAKVLYKAFRKADDMGLKKIVVVPPSGKGICDAIFDRLVKASIRYVEI